MVATVSRRGGTTWVRRIGAAALVAALAATGCSSTRELSADRSTETTIRRLPDDELLDEEALETGSAAARSMEAIVAKLLASNDPCAILTQQEIRGYNIDATALAGSAVRQTMARGVVSVYNHTINVVPQTEDQLIAALRVQRDTFVQVLDVVDRYSSNPTSRQGNQQIENLVRSDQFVKASEAVNGWIYQNCS